MILVYEDEPIVAAFHSMSSGTTESAENIWGVNLSYLVPCDSSSDKNAPGYEEEYIFTPEEIKARHRIQSKLYSINNPEKYREIYTKANQRRKEAKRQWYLNNRERILAKQREKYASGHSLKPS